MAVWSQVYVCVGNVKYTEDGCEGSDLKTEDCLWLGMVKCELGVHVLGKVERLSFACGWDGLYVSNEGLGRLGTREKGRVYK